MKLTQEQLQNIARLAFTIEPKHYNEIKQGRNTLYRDMSFKELLLSIMIDQSVQSSSKDQGIHICVMHNGDIFARIYPYYDGDLSGLLMVNNQKKIRDIILNNIPDLELLKLNIDRFEKLSLLKKRGLKLQYGHDFNTPLSYSYENLTAEISEFCISVKLEDWENI